MDIDGIRRCCLGFAHATENVQWGHNLCFKIAGRLFAVAPLEPAAARLSFKASAENFAELCERPGIIPAPYMARAQWVALQQLDALSDSELRDLLAESYRLVFERLPKKTQAELNGAASAAKSKAKPAAKKVARKKQSRQKPKNTKSAREKSARAGTTR